MANADDNVPIVIMANLFSILNDLEIARPRGGSISLAVMLYRRGHGLVGDDE